MKQRTNLEFMLVHTHMHTFIEHHIFIQQQNSDSCKWPIVCTILFSYMFIPNLYMFRALMCSSLGELIVSIQHLVYVTVYRWPSGVQTCTPNSHLYRVTYTRCHIDIINSPDDENMAAQKYVENRNKHTWKRIVHQVGYLLRLGPILLADSPLSDIYIHR